MALERDSTKQVDATVKRFVSFCTRFSLSPVSILRQNGTDVAVVNPNAITTFFAYYCSKKTGRHTSKKGCRARNLHAVQSLLKRGMRSPPYWAIWPSEVGPPWGILINAVLKDTITGFKKKDPFKEIDKKMPWLLQYTFKIADMSPGPIPPLSLREFEARTVVSNRACLRCISTIKLRVDDFTFDYGDGRPIASHLSAVAKLRQSDKLWMEVSLRAEKNNKVRQARSVRFNCVGGRACIVTTVIDWILYAKLKHSDSMFSKYHHLSSVPVPWTRHTIAKQMKYLGRLIGLTLRKLGTHSLRRGGIADYLHEDVPLEFIVYITGHKSLAFLEYFAATDHVMISMFNRLRAFNRRRATTATKLLPFSSA